MKLPLLALLLGSALRASAAEPSFDVRLVEPAVGTRVVAGSGAFLTWNATATPASVDEWEAFISIDGGRTFLSRITPHLDATIHRFQFTVPNLPGAEITVLLRFGDEDEERRFLFPARLRISGMATDLPAATSAEAEPFDVDEEGATSWIEGSRDGSSLRSIVLGGSAMSSDPAELRAPLRDRPAAALTTSSSRHDSIRVSVAADRASADDPRLQAAGSDLPLLTDILLMSRRRNV